MTKTTPILAIILSLLLLSVIVSAILFSNQLEQSTDVGDTPLNISIGEVDLTGYPNPLGGTLTDDPRHFPSYIIRGELIDEKVIITPTATMNATLYLSITGDQLTTRAWIWDGSWTELSFTTEGTTKTATVHSGEMVGTIEIPILIQFNSDGHKALEWWCEG